MYSVMVLFGSNIEPQANFRAALRELRTNADIQLHAVSNVYVTPAVTESGAVDTARPSYHNAAVLLQTPLERQQLQRLLRGIEDRLGRIRTADKFADRTADLDILGYLVEDTLDAADPTIEKQAFAAIPAAETAPNWIYPASCMTLAEIADRFRGHGNIQTRRAN